MKHQFNKKIKMVAEKLITKQSIVSLISVLFIHFSLFLVTHFLPSTPLLTLLPVSGMSFCCMYNYLCICIVFKILKWAVVIFSWGVADCCGLGKSLQEASWSACLSSCFCCCQYILCLVCVSCCD